MYVPEEGMKETLRSIAAESAPGSALLMEYLNRGMLELMRKYPTGMIKNAFDWGEPFVFGVPDGQDREFFLEAGLELGETLKIGSPESVTDTPCARMGATMARIWRKCFSSGAKPP